MPAPLLFTAFMVTALGGCFVALCLGVFHRSAHPKGERRQFIVYWVFRHDPGTMLAIPVTGYPHCAVFVGDIDWRSDACGVRIMWGLRHTKPVEGELLYRHELFIGLRSRRRRPSLWVFRIG